MKSAIAIDSWKQQTFETILTEEEWNYKVGPGITPDTKTITVHHEPRELTTLASTVERCHLRAAQLEQLEEVRRIMSWKFSS